MLKIFQKWLFIFIIIAFVIIFSATYVIQSMHSQDNAYNLIELRISDVKSQIEQSRNNAEQIKEMANSVSILKAKMFAKMIYYNPAILKDQKQLEETRKFLNVDELHVSDSKGILIASVPKRFVGFDMSSTAQSRLFLGALKNPYFEYVQEPMPKGADNMIFQYAAVSRIKDKGLVQIGLKATRLKEAMDLADIKNIAHSFRVGVGGSMIVFKDDKLYAKGSDIKELNKNESDEILNDGKDIGRHHSVVINGVDYFTLSDKWEDYLIVGLLPKSEIFSQRNTILSYFVVVDILILLIVFVLVTILLKKEVIKGIYTINDSLKKITNGNLNEKIGVTTSPEFKDLSEGINMTVDALKNVIDAEARRISRELKLAKDIQMSSLPSLFPPFPEYTEFDIYATMETAKEVGGDFYDFFFIDNDHLAFMIADVSGKGIPAALFMMTTKTLLNNLAQSGISPDKLFTEANKKICETNEKGLFVTVFFGLLELSTGELHCVNAGHNPPLLMRNNKSYEYLKIPPCLVLGGLEHIRYKSHKITLKEGDRLLLYTDGITEAMDIDNKQYSEQRLLEFVNQTDIKKADIEECLKFIKKDVKTFAKDTEQSDDMTMLLIDYHGTNSISETVSFQAKKENFKLFIEWLESICIKENIPEKAMNNLLIVAEEIFVNIASYGYPDNDGELSVRLNIFKSENKLRIKFTDTGIPYNPLDTQEPDISLSAEERNIGGLGIFMTKKLSESISYRYKDKKNILLVSLSY